MRLLNITAATIAIITMLIISSCSNDDAPIVPSIEITGVGADGSIPQDDPGATLQRNDDGSLLGTISADGAEVIIPLTSNSDINIEITYKVSETKTSRGIYDSLHHHTRTLVSRNDQIINLVLKEGAETTLVGKILGLGQIDDSPIHIIFNKNPYTDSLVSSVILTPVGGESSTQITIWQEADEVITEDKTQKLNLVYPNMDFTPFSRSEDTPQLRAVVEVFRKDSETRVLRKTEFVDSANPQIELTLEKGEYDVRVWSDYSQQDNIDNNYITANTKSIRVRPQVSYVANSNYKDAFAGVASLNIGDDNPQELSIELHRPFAKYKIVATDVAKYEELREEEDLPPIEDLQIEILYENFFPTAYNMIDKILNGSDTGYKYTGSISELTADSVTLASDYIMADGRSSSVGVQIYVRDKEGEVISSSFSNVINYEANHLTTISGNFLTTGEGGIKLMRDTIELAAEDTVFNLDLSAINAWEIDSVKAVSGVEAGSINEWIQSLRVGTNPDVSVNSDGNVESGGGNSGDHEILFLCNANTFTTPRTAEIIVKMGDIRKTVTVTQAAAKESDAGLILSPESIEIDANEGFFEFTVTATEGWVIERVEAISGIKQTEMFDKWIGFLGAYGVVDPGSEDGRVVGADVEGTAGTHTIPVECYLNTSSTARTARIVVKMGDVRKYITITQGGV